MYVYLCRAGTTGFRHINRKSISSELSIESANLITKPAAVPQSAAYFPCLLIHIASLPLQPANARF
jgi:hypothetical protein